MANIVAERWRYVQLALLCLACCASLYAAHGQFAKAVSHVWSFDDYSLKGIRGLSSKKQAVMQAELELLYGTVHDVKTRNSRASRLHTMPSSSELVQAMRDVVRGRHIVFVGDSVTRYQYLALVAAVHGGHWDWRGSPKYNPDQLPLTREGLFNSWTQFYDVTTNIFEGSMECDCYRRKGDFNHVIENIIENRVYRGRESTIEYIQHFSDTGKNSIRFRPGVLVQKESDADLTMRLTTFLGHVLPMRQQVPDAVIVNFGLHQCSDQWSEEDLAALANSSSRAGSLMIWKTTTFRSGYPPVSPSCDVPALQAFERCGSKWHIFNAYNITTELWSSRHTQKNSIMFDANHYELIAYCILNLHLLLQLADLW